MVKCLSPVLFFFLIGFVFLLLSCKSSLYILDTNPLSDRWLASSFSHSISWSFIQLIVSFAVRVKTRSFLVWWVSVACAFGVMVLRNHHCQDQCQGVFPCVFFWSFTDRHWKYLLEGRAHINCSCQKKTKQIKCEETPGNFGSDGYVIALIVVMGSQVYLGALTLKCIC